MTKNFTPDPVLIEAAKYARKYVESAYPEAPSMGCICDAAYQLWEKGEEAQSIALQGAVDSVLGGHFVFLPKALYAKRIGPITNYPPKDGDACAVRLWWLDQIIAGKPVPGAEV